MNDDVFKSVYERTQRRGVVLAHQRSGTTTMLLKDLVRKAVKDHDHKRFAYFCPYQGQLRQNAWPIMMNLVAPLRPYDGFKAHHDRMMINLGESSIELFSMEMQDRNKLRGANFNAISFDCIKGYAEQLRSFVEYPTSELLFAGVPTAARNDEMFAMYNHAINYPEKWFSLRVPSSESGIIPQDELERIKDGMSPDEFAAEFECKKPTV